MVRRGLAAALISTALTLPATPAGAHMPKPAAKAAASASKMVKLTKLAQAGRLAVVKRVYYSHKGPGGAATSSRGSLGTCPNPATCEVWKLGKARWPLADGAALTIPWRYSDQGRPSRAPSADAVRAAVAGGGAEWHRWNGRITFSYAGATDARPGAAGVARSCADGVNAIGWRTMSSSVIGATFVCYDTQTMQIQEIDLAFNSALRWGALGAADPRGETFDVQAIATHELGHWLSLLDLYTSRSRAMTMHGSAKPGQTFQRTLALGDVVALQTAYPCRSGDACGRAGFAIDGLEERTRRLRD